MKLSLPSSRVPAFILTASLLASLAFSTPPAPAAPAGAQTDLNGPAGSGMFGTQIAVLPNGNIVVTDPNYVLGGQPQVGAVYLYNGRTHALLSTLTGSTAYDAVGQGDDGIPGITVLPSGNFVVDSPRWNNATAVQAGAVTWCSGTLGCSGMVTTTNSLVGGATNDRIGGYGLVVLTNGNYVVGTPSWNNGSDLHVGAATWVNGATGRSGLVSAANSLVGRAAGDSVGGPVIALSNGHYVVGSPYWANGGLHVGAATWANGATGLTGMVSVTNSLVGSAAGDYVGSRIIALHNGNYLVASSGWDNGAAPNVGAVTWANGAGGTTGVVTTTNSLVGSQPDDRVGVNVTALSNGNYVVASSLWTNRVGAATWGNGAVATVGVVTTTNSLVGSAADDEVGALVYALANGNYVVGSPYWANGIASSAGAATWGNGATGTTGVVTTTNSLVGGAADDDVGSFVYALANGNYVVGSPQWANGAATRAGAATWGNGATGITGMVSVANSLVGSTANDTVGGGLRPLSNGNYVVSSDSWDNGPLANVGAVTWGNGATGRAGVVSTTNSLVGSAAGDEVGSAYPLANGNYVVSSPGWTHGTAGSAGAVTWANGATGLTGVVTVTNSLVGGTTYDYVGEVYPLANGNFVVVSAHWNNGPIGQVGAVTLGDDLVGTAGPLTGANSVLGGVVNGGPWLNFDYDYVNDQLVVGRPAENRVTFFLAPGLHVFGQGVPIPNGAAAPSVADGTDFGAVNLGEALTHTFTISNSSLGSLALTGVPLVKIAGAAAADFSVVTPPLTPVLAGAATTVQVRFQPTRLAQRAVTVTLLSADADASPYVFALQGLGVPQHGVYLPLVRK